MTVEFELLKYKNVDGRLLSGDCCNGLKVQPGSSCLDSSGNSCNPYWKICLTHQSGSSSGESQIVVMPTQMRFYSRGHHSSSNRNRHRPSNNKPVRISSKNRNEPVASTVAPVATTLATTTERPSFFKSIYNRVLGGIKSVQSLSDYVSFSNTKTTYTISPSCSLAFWTTNVTHVIDEKNKVLLRSELPSSILSKMRNDDLKGKGTSEKVLVFVEIWNKKSAEEGGEKLISRHVEQTNVTIQVRRNQSLNDDDYEWKEGGISSSSISSNSAGSSFKGTEFKYRWRILSDDDEVTETNGTSIMCPDGFKGSDCKEPICSTGCNTSHGYCEKPSECKCKFGWTG